MSRATTTLRKLRPLYENLYRGLALLPIKPILRIQSKRCGLFGDLAITLNAIRFAQLSQLDCTVDWGKRSLYYDSETGNNVWKGLFQDISFQFSKTNKKGGYSIPYFESAYGFPPYEAMTERDSLARAIDEWCKPTDEIQELVDQYKQQHFADTNLGVHYRGTDAIAGFEGRTVAQLDKIEQAIADWLVSHPTGKVFLASDDAQAVERLRQRFPEALHSRDCLRSTDGNSLHGHYDAGHRASGQQKATEVLVDSLLLSSCDTLIHSKSRVAWFAINKNPLLQELILN